MNGLRIAIALLGLATTSAAWAQSNPAEPASPVPATPAPAVDTQRDSFTVGAGVAVLPDYEGSDDYRFIPAVQGRGQVSGISFFTRGAALYVDLVPQAEGETVDFALGPLVAANLSRTNRRVIDDRAIRALPQLDTAIEVGGFAGISKTGVVTSAYDVLSARVAYQRDVAGSHDSYLITPSIDYLTPLSTRNLVGISASMQFVGDGWARQYFGITPGASTASGLAPYQLDGGLKSYSLSMIGAQSLSGDIRSGFALFGAVSYTRLLGDFADSPIVTVDGSPNQWVGAIGIGYTF